MCTHVYAHMCMRTCVCAQVYVHMCMHKCVCAHVYVYMCMRTCVSTQCLHLSIGIGLVYSLEQICILAVLNSMFLFWSVAFPISYRQFKISERIRYTHIICVVVAVVIPIPGGLVHLKDGFIFVGNPAGPCVGRNSDYNFYLFVLPISITLMIVSCLLVLTIWTIFKVL